MKVTELAAQCAQAINACTGLGANAEDAQTLIVTPKGWKPPAGFPRRDIVQIKENGDRVAYLPALRVLMWMVRSGLVKVADGKACVVSNG